MRYLDNINVLNLLLAGLLIFLLKAHALPLFQLNKPYSLSSVKKTADAVTVRSTKQEEKSPSLSDYVVIAEQNLFHPDRIIPVPKVEAPPLPKPEFVLYGTLVTDSVQVAYMDDKKSEDKKNRVTAQGKRQTAVRLGDSLSGFLLKEIGRDQVVMQRGEEKVTVSLNDSKTREVPGVAQTPPPGQARRAGTRGGPAAANDRRTPNRRSVNFFAES